MNIKPPDIIIHPLITPEEYFPGNSRFPLLIYRQIIDFNSSSAEEIQILLKQNNWNNAWTDKLYDYPHYHSNTHEVLVIISGEAEVQFNGENGNIYAVAAGDVIIIPAGVAHKARHMSHDFLCVGAYPGNVNFDVNCGHAEEYTIAIRNVKHAELPEKDPIFGAQGPLFKYWEKGKGVKC